MNITIIKLNHHGEETWRYEGQVVKRSENFIIIEAFFDREDMHFHGLNLCMGDKFMETYYFDRWYNIFEIYDRDDQKLKGWYCNICGPAFEKENALYYKDLALDLIVFPDGRQIILDEDEFANLKLSPQETQKALEALAALQQNFTEKIRAPK